MTFSGRVFVLVAVLWFTGGGPSPSLTMHDFKSREACERAGRELEKKIDDETSGFALHWYCTQK